MLRGTVEALAGVLGGCSSMQVGAFDEVVRQPDDFSVRIARNTQLVLQKECLLDHVIDPLGGSWFVESLTGELAERAWALFQEVEKLGGMEAALRAGFPQKQTAASNAERQKAVARRRDSVVGVNQYANPAEKPLEVPAIDATTFHKRRVQQITSHRTALEDDENAQVLQRLAAIIGTNGPALLEACVTAASSGATLGEITRAVRISDSPCAPITPVELERRSVPMETLREATERHARKSGQAPKVFLCTMGSMKEYKARADFSAAFFAVGGYSAEYPAGFKSPEEAAAAFATSTARVAVICSTDDNYPTLVPPLVDAIRAKRADALVVLAGYPQDHIEAFKKSGVDEFIHIRADLLETLCRIHAKLGIEP
jgi:methylmalonyl-CoA mutase